MLSRTALDLGATMTPPPSPPVSSPAPDTHVGSRCTPTRIGNFYSDTLNRDLVRANAGVIQRAWQRFQQHVAGTTQTALLAEDRSTHAGYKALEYRPDNLQRYPARENDLGRVFYCSPCGLPPLRYPVWDEGAEYRVLSGKFKRVVTWDRRFLAMEPVDPVTQPFADGTPDPRLERLRGIGSLVFSTVIHPKLAITRNAGTDLFEYAQWGGQLPITAFHNLLVDLDHLHRLPDGGGAFLRDIKAENAAIPLALHTPLPPGPLPPVRIFDFEQDVVFGDELAMLQPVHARGTAACLTEGLKRGLYLGPAARRAAFAAAADNYACMLMIILLTAGPGSTLQLSVTGAERMRVRGPLPPGIMRAANAHLFEPWLERHVHPKQVQNMRELLTDPAKYALEHPKPAPLVQMLRFEVSD